MSGDKVGCMRGGQRGVGDKSVADVPTTVAGRCSRNQY